MSNWANVIRNQMSKYSTVSTVAPWCPSDLGNPPIVLRVKYRYISPMDPDGWINTREFIHHPPVTQSAEMEAGLSAGGGGGGIWFFGKCAALDRDWIPKFNAQNTTESTPVTQNVYSLNIKIIFLCFRIAKKFFFQTFVTCVMRVLVTSPLYWSNISWNSVINSMIHSLGVMTNTDGSVQLEGCWPPHPLRTNTGRAFTSTNVISFKHNWPIFKFLAGMYNFYSLFLKSTSRSHLRKFSCRNIEITENLP